ncbi:hypothetical protein [Engelhardtia mirabilis]|uniref:Uncharacterized protein n=1 Tax=Engelhardtia mirabilis TaxID=2528011 RepID=A0A518BG03_9BACT|nr:hypothetical protein Pla133_09760 [Planctomycetes bacterium Pla133]QDV00236.1 hypothetical protein Pla86_09750 [Planctomycetes bacterium Pla86]
MAPDFASNPFVPSDQAPLGGVWSGAGFYDGLRDVNASSPTCEANEAAALWNNSNIASGCLCPLALTAPHATARHMKAIAGTLSSFESINLFPALPWYDVVSTSIGSWSNDTSYPGAEHVWVDEGVFLHTEACTVSGPPVTYVEVKLGATTEGGYPALVSLLVPSDRFTDMVDNYSVPLGSPISPPYFGSMGPSHHLSFVCPF